MIDWIKLQRLLQIHIGHGDMAIVISSRGVEVEWLTRAGDRGWKWRYHIHDSEIDFINSGVQVDTLQTFADRLLHYANRAFEARENNDKKS